MLENLGPDNEDAHPFCGTPEYLAPDTVTNMGHAKAVGILPFCSQQVNNLLQEQRYPARVRKEPLFGACVVYVCIKYLL